MKREAEQKRFHYVHKERGPIRARHFKEHERPLKHGYAFQLSGDYWGRSTFYVDKIIFFFNFTIKIICMALMRLQAGLFLFF